ncbi:MAG: translation initiation factor IF-3 [Patescibacteria group bacterium]|nr:MAG: translation initiation factor IF-3 [Patescibacteria group bacterium]
MKNKLKDILSNWRINQKIRAEKVRVIDADKKFVGIMTLKEALEKGQELGLDLVEIAPKANPPVVRMIELGKFKYEQEKRLKKEKKGAKGGETKEIRFSPFIAEADYQNRIERIREFLKEGNKVRIVVKFKGAQMGSKDFGYDLIKRVISEVGLPINIDMEPKFLGRHLASVISPMSKSKKEGENKNAENQN